MRVRGILDTIGSPWVRSHLIIGLSKLLFDILLCSSSKGGDGGTVEAMSACLKLRNQVEAPGRVRSGRIREVLAESLKLVHLGQLLDGS